MEKQNLTFIGTPLLHYYKKKQKTFAALLDFFITFALVIAFNQFLQANDAQPFKAAT